MPIPLRGLRTIRTLAGKVSQTVVPHRAHLQIACLEIEKTRRAAELDARLREIEAEQARLLQALAEHKAKNAAPKPLSPGRSHPFRIRY
jgi:hypothetical protein